MKKMKKEMMNTILLYLIFMVALIPLSYADDCNGWGGVEAGGEVVCCSCETSDGICPDNLTDSTVCTYGDTDCGNCDTTPPEVTWIQPTESTSWIDGDYTFKVKATDPQVDNQITRGLYTTGNFYVDGSYAGETTETNGSNGDLSIQSWLIYDTTHLSSGETHSFRMEMRDLANNTNSSPTIEIVVCNDKDPTACEQACNESGYRWETNQSTNNSFCCGDDPNEYDVKDYDPSYRYACCPYSTDCSFQEKCYRQGSVILTSYGYLVCGADNTFKQRCENPQDVGFVDVNGKCCTVEATDSDGNGRVIPTYQQILNSSITSEDYFMSGCFDGLDTDCDGSVDDCEDCNFEGMGLNTATGDDYRNIDYDNWKSYYEAVGYTDYSKGVVDEECCADGKDNDNNGCYDKFDISNGKNKADWKCDKEIYHTSLMFDLTDNDCDGNFDFGKVPYSQGGNWTNYNQAIERFEEYSTYSSKILLHGTVKDINNNPIPYAKVTAWLRDGWYNGLEETSDSLKEMNLHHRDYFTTYADKNGNYTIYINAYMPYTFVASQSKASESTTTYDSAIKSIEANALPFSTKSYIWNPKLMPSDMVSCDGCKLVGSNRCYAGCIGKESCPFPDWADSAEEQQKLRMTCADVLASTSVSYDSSHDVLCCNGPLMVVPKQVTAHPTLESSTVKNAVTHSETVSLEGIPVKMKIVIFEK